MKIHVSLSGQNMRLIADTGEVLRDYPVSTAANGAGEICGSFCTPRGKHLIRAKVGAGLAMNTVFQGRRPTGEIYNPELGAAHPGRDWILTRILWLSGCKPGFNRLGKVDSMRRYIYIHGTPDETRLGQPGSRGCIRMSNADVVELFDLVPAYTSVLMTE